MDKIAMLTEILAANPLDAFARYGLALEYVGQQRFDEAFAEFAKLVELNPEYVPGYQMYAQTLLKAGHTSDAIAMMRRGMECAERAGNTHAWAEMSEMLNEIEGEMLP